MYTKFVLLHILVKCQKTVRSRGKFQWKLQLHQTLYYKITTTDHAAFVKRKQFRNRTVSFSVVSVAEFTIHGDITDDVFLRAFLQKYLSNNRRNKLSSNLQRQ